MYPISPSYSPYRVLPEWSDVPIQHIYSYPYQPYVPPQPYYNPYVLPQPDYHPDGFWAVADYKPYVPPTTGNAHFTKFWMRFHQLYPLVPKV